MKNKFIDKINRNINTLTFNFWMYFVSFSILLFVILWIMEVVLLQNYYSIMKKIEVEKIVKNIEKYYGSDSYDVYLDSVAYKNSSTIYIFDMNGEIKYSSNNMSELDMSNLTIRKGIVKIQDIKDKILENSNSKISFTLKLDRFKSNAYVYGERIVGTDEYIVMITPIEPIDSTIKVLKSQLTYITIISLVISSVISIFISKRLSRPIKNINETAKKLANGNYDITFKKAGYKEIDDLVDTLNLATSQLAKTDKIKKELIANVSHDLRTPLTMIKAYSEMIRDISGDDKEKREEHLKIIIDETDRLTELVNDMMDLSKIQSGIMKLNTQSFELINVINNMVKKFNNIKDSNNCIVKIEAPEQVFVLADKSKIQQVLYNLISNAINHSGNKEKDNLKEIKIKVINLGKKVRIQIIDNGVGIEKEDLIHIWDRYYKANNSFKRESTGTGLGLSIVKNILTIHNVDYGVESKVGIGTNFWFELNKISKREEKELKNELNKEIKNTGKDVKMLE